MTNDSVTNAIAIIRKDFDEQGRVHETRMGYVVDLMIWCEEKLDEMMANVAKDNVKTSDFIVNSVGVATPSISK